MPIPKPRAGESKKEYVKRCMANDTMANDTMAKEYGVDQRFAICVAKWEEER